MNNKIANLDEAYIAQKSHEQQEWDRLQNEAVAAQRWRLEQELEEARRDNVDSDTLMSLGNMPYVSAGRLISSALVLFVVATLAAAVAYTW